MIKDLSPFYSKNARNLQSSVIRELLKLTRKPEIISFAGGLPAPETFPVEAIEQISCRILRERGRFALQYGPTEGEMPLREELAKWMALSKPGITPANILITSGSQQGLDIVAKVFIDPGDIVVMELPSYIGGIQAFSAYRAKMIGVSQDSHGMRMDLLEKTLARLAKRHKKPKFIYVVPDFQNPSGVTLTEARRRRLLELAYAYEVPIVEDSPYRDLRFRGVAQPPIYGLDTQDQVIVLGTFSKIFCPGLRLAWLMAPASWTDRMVVSKQSMDLASPTFNQMIAAEYMRQGLLRPQIEAIRKLYGKKRNIMLKALKEFMPKGVRWTKPEGGLFLWVKLPRTMNATTLFRSAVDENVAYVVGEAFYCNGKGQNTMRLNFSYPSEEQIVEGIRRLAAVIKKNM
ncbi:PLP-dependent aminotransferase family protein [Candidatus Fermentibacteria bacterium]|nr:PLP-dependent aminotransferase family protein [Candidatus Fermentibacteria bacterium]